MDYNKYSCEKLTIKINTIKKSKKNKSKKYSQLNDNSNDDYSEKKNLYSEKNNKSKVNSSKLKSLKKGIKETFNEFSNKGLRKYKKINNDKKNCANNNNMPYFSIMIILYSVIYYFVYKIIKSRKKIDDDIYENIYDENIYNRTLNNITNMKKVVYTINFGNYDQLRNITRQEGFDYFAYLDTGLDQYNYSNWTILPVPQEIKNLNVSVMKKTRYIKTHPHLFFKNYSLSIYIDAAYPIIGDLNEFLLRILEPKYNIYCLEHYERNCIYKEIKEVVRVKREKKEMANIVEEKYKKENVPHYFGIDRRRPYSKKT